MSKLASFFGWFKKNYRTTIIGAGSLTVLGLGIASDARKTSVTDALVKNLGDPNTIAAIAGGVGLIVAADAKKDDSNSDQ